MAQADVFTFAAGVVALLLAAGLLIAYAINRRLKAFGWWAGSFVLLALWLTTVTLRLGTPVVWIKWISWGSFYGAACLVAYGLYRQGAIRSPIRRMLACGVLLLAIAVTLTLLDARPHHWMLLGPVPTLLLMAWSTILIFRAGAWGYGLTALAGMGAAILLPLLHPAGLARALAPAGPPPPALRGGFGPGSEPGEAAIALGARPPIGGILDFAPPPANPPPVEQPLTITLLIIAALLTLAVALVLRDMLAEFSRMRERSSTDAMTGLLNRVTFEESATVLLAEAGAQGVCMVLFDIDHFKRINDTAGHAAGDQVIARLGQLLRENTLLHYTAGRIGGEEFAVILANADTATARLFAEAIRAGFSASDFGDDIGWGVTVSAGIAMHQANETLHGLTARADKALYAAKAAGRDRSVIAQGPQDNQWHGSDGKRAASA